MRPLHCLLTAIAVLSAAGYAHGQDQGGAAATAAKETEKAATQEIEEVEKPVTKPPSQQELATLISQLDSDDFRVRETAQLRLTEITKSHTETALDPVLKEYLKSSTPESRYRLRAILYGAKRADFKNSPRGFVGIVMMPGFIRDKDGNLIQIIQVGDVIPESAADRDGLKLRDQILSIDDLNFQESATAEGTESTSKFADYVTDKVAGDKVTLKILRNNQPMTIPLTLGKRPSQYHDYRSLQRFDREFKNWLEENSARLQSQK